MLIGIIGSVLLIALIVVDWKYFAGMTPQASTYGCRVAQLADHLPSSPSISDLRGADQQSILQLPHGFARLFMDEGRILLRPRYDRFSTRLRTVWPMKVTLSVESAPHGADIIGIKRIPWSSALLTLAWFLIVVVGTAGFLVSFFLNDGFDSLGGIFLAIGVTGLGLIVLAFGLVVVALAYRLEDQRLSQAYDELRAALKVV